MKTKTNPLTQFGYELYQNFNNDQRADVLMDWVDALSSNTTARSVVQLSLNPHFRRHYTARGTRSRCQTPRKIPGQAQKRQTHPAKPPAGDEKSLSLRISGDEGIQTRLAILRRIETVLSQRGLGCLRQNGDHPSSNRHCGVEYPI